MSELIRQMHRSELIRQMHRDTGNKYADKIMLKAVNEIERLESVVRVARQVVHDDDSYFNVTLPLAEALEALNKEQT